MPLSLGFRPFTILSPIIISPPEIVSKPATILSVVDLPHPEGPTKTQNSPLEIEISIP